MTPDERKKRGEAVDAAVASMGLGPILTLAWVEKCKAEIAELHERAYSEAARRCLPMTSRMAMVDDANAKQATLYAAIVGAVAFGNCDPDPGTICRAAMRR